MYWYNFGRNEVYIGNGGNFRHSRDCMSISSEEKQKIADFFSERLLAIYKEYDRSYDNSDDERVIDSHHSSSSCVYREVDVENDLYGLVMRNGEVTGIVFYIKDGNDIYTKVFNFNGEPATWMRLGYSASHSSSYTTVERVKLVKKGENGAPESAKKATFIQSQMYPEI